MHVVLLGRYGGDKQENRCSENGGRAPTCREGTWGARFHKVAPAPGELVVTKHACFDAFLTDGFEHHLRRRRIEHLVFAGVYADVCVDSTARTAFQKGWHITLLVDSTTSLVQRDEDTVRFMADLYGARTTTHDRPDTWCDPAGREDERCSVRASH